MRDHSARTRTGLNRGTPRPPDDCRRVRVEAADLRALEPQARGLRLLPRQRARSVLNGRHGSRLRGRGLNFEELRGYLPGDDVRSIDWKVTARTGRPHVRVYTEERDRPALLVVDQRMSMFFGSRLQMKSVTAAETAALLAHAVIAQGDRVGGIVFGDQALAELRPKASRRALDALVVAVANANGVLSADAPTVDAMPLNRPLEAAARIAHRDHLVLVISDFDGVDERTERLLGGLARHNDVLLFLVTDPLAHRIEGEVRVIASDGVLQAELDTASSDARRSLLDFSKRRIGAILDWERRLGLPVLPMSAGDETLPQLRRLLGLSGGAA